MTLKEYAGAAPATRLNGSLASGTTSSFTVITSGGSGYPTGATAPFVVVIDRGTSLEEKILVTSRSGDTFSTLTRGYDGTSAQSHSAQAVVEHVLDAASVTEANAHTNTTTRDDHTQYSKTDGSRAYTGSTALTAIAGSSAIGDSAGQGSLHTLSRSDHKHGREGPQRVGHSFLVANYVAVASGPIDYIPPIFVPVAAGRTVKLVGYKCIVRAGSCTVKLQINGVDATGFTALSVTTGASTATPTPISMANGDQLALVVTANSSADNLSFTAYLEHA